MRFSSLTTNYLAVIIVFMIAVGCLTIFGEAASQYDTATVQFDFAASSDVDECNTDDHGLAFESLIALANLPSRIYSVASSALSNLLHLGGSVLQKVGKALAVPTAALCLATVVYLNVTPKDKDFIQRLAVGVPLAAATVISFPLLLSSLPITLISVLMTKTGDAFSTYFSSPESFFRFVQTIVKKIKSKIFKKADGKEPGEAAEVIGDEMKKEFIPIVKESVEQWKKDETVKGNGEGEKVEKWANSLRSEDVEPFVDTAVEAEQFSANLKNNNNN